MSTTNSTGDILHLALPKGRMQDGVIKLLGEAGISVSVPTGARGYRPRINLPGVETKILKPQNIVEMLHTGTRDAGFAGADWVAELDSELVEVLDTGLDQVSIVVAAPAALLEHGRLPRRPLRVVSEMPNIVGKWIGSRGCGDTFVRSYGATEVFPPEDADCIVDISASGATLEANNLIVAETITTSSTRLYASRRAWGDAGKKRRIEELAMLVRSVLEARGRVMLELNATEATLAGVAAALPAMKSPTISQLSTPGAYALKAVVKRTALPTLIPALRAAGGTDIVISPIAQVVP